MQTAQLDRTSNTTPFWSGGRQGVRGQDRAPQLVRTVLFFSDAGRCRCEIFTCREEPAPNLGGSMKWRMAQKSRTV